MRAVLITLIVAGCAARPTTSMEPSVQVDDVKKRNVMERRTGAVPCTAQTECAAKCRDNGAWACALAADARRAANDEAGATVLYRKACNLHDPDGCGEIALLALDGKVTTPEHPFAMLRVACELGAAHSCREGAHRIYAAYNESARTHPNDQKLHEQLEDLWFPMFRAVCDAEVELEACLHVRDWKRACALGDAGACERAETDRVELDGIVAKVKAGEQADLDAATAMTARHVAEQAENDRIAARQREQQAKEAAVAQAKLDAEEAERVRKQRALDQLAADRAAQRAAQDVRLTPVECQTTLDDVCTKMLMNLNKQRDIKACRNSDVGRDFYSNCLHVRCGTRLWRCFDVAQTQDELRACFGLFDSCGLVSD